MPKPGGTTARGYGSSHATERKRVAQLVEAGGQVCVRCLREIAPGSFWDLGHTEDRSGWTGPEHRRCNRSAGARKRNGKARRRRAFIALPVSRVW